MENIQAVFIVLDIKKKKKKQKKKKFKQKMAFLE
jgi:hypothetical protein